VVKIYESQLMLNARNVEDAVRRKFQHQPFGTVRLWRCVDNGEKYKLPYGSGKTHKVGIVYSTKIPELIASGDIIIHY